MPGKRVCPKGTSWDSRKQKCVPSEIASSHPPGNFFEFEASRTIRTGPQSLSASNYTDVTRKVQELFEDSTDRDMENLEDAREAAKMFINDRFPDYDAITIKQIVDEVDAVVNVDVIPEVRKINRR